MSKVQLQSTAAISAPAVRPRLAPLGAVVDVMLAAVAFGINVFVPSDRHR